MVDWPVVSMAVPPTSSSMLMKMASARERSNTSRAWPLVDGSSATSVSYNNHNTVNPLNGHLFAKISDCYTQIE